MIILTLLSLCTHFHPPTPPIEAERGRKATAVSAYRFFFLFFFLTAIDGGRRDGQRAYIKTTAPLVFCTFDFLSLSIAAAAPISYKSPKKVNRL